MSKGLMKKLIGAFALILVLVLGVFLLQGEEELVDDNEIGGPPGITIDSGYNATLSGTPFYTVLEEDEDMYDNNLDTCSELGGESDRQQGWYSLVALEDGKTAKEVVFEQAQLEEGDNILAVYYNPEDKTFEAMPNKIIKSGDGNDLPLLNWDRVINKGEVVVVNSNRSVDFCKDYEPSSGHDEVTVGAWNLISKPDFDAVGYRSIWSVDFSGQNLTQYYKGGDAGFDADSLSENNLYWIYGGELVTETEDTSTADNSDDNSDNNTGNDTEDSTDNVDDSNADGSTQGDTQNDNSDSTDDSSTGTGAIIIDNDLGDINTGGINFGGDIIQRPVDDLVIMNPGFDGIDFDDFIVPSGLKLRKSIIDYTEDIILDAPKNVDRNNQAISLQFGRRAQQRDYVIFWEPDAGNARTIRIRARDNINDAWAGCSVIRVTVSGLKYQDGTNVPDGEFDVETNDNGKCGDETDMSFNGKEKLQKFPNESGSFYGTAEAVFYDEIGRGFWAINNNGEIFENFSQNDGEWRRLPGLSTINRPISNGGQSDYVKDTDQFYVMDSEVNGRRYSLISWVGKDNRFYRYKYTGDNIIDGSVTAVDKFGTSVKDTTMSTFRNTSTNELEDVIYVAYSCDTSVIDTVGFNADPKTFVKCDVQPMTEFGTSVGILGNDFLMQGDAYFASPNNVWAINSFNGWTERYNINTSQYKQITTANNPNRSSVQELFFNNGNTYGINSQNRLFAWNDAAEAWREVDYGDTKLSNVFYIDAGLVYANVNTNTRELFEIRCDSVVGTGDPNNPILNTGCARPTEFGRAYRVDGQRAVAAVKFDGDIVFALKDSERTLYRYGFKENGERGYISDKTIEAFNSGEVLQVIDAGDRVFVLFEYNGDRYLINPYL